MTDNTSMTEDSCGICTRPKEQGVTMRNAGKSDALSITCPRCGTYNLLGSEVIADTYNWDAELRASLSCAARQAHEAGEPLTITSRNAAELAAPHMQARVADNLERLLQVAAKRAGRPHRGAWFNLNDDIPVIDCHSRDEFEWYINWLKQRNLAFQTGAGPDNAQLTLSMEGWNQVQPLSRPGGIPGRCFVAMWFANETKAAYERGIEPAVKQAGFNAMRIDMKEHNNEIPDEIMAEIRNAQFVVADFTGQRNGVYYEAGFAMGLGRPVIWCCREDHIQYLHFDTNHRNHIPWSTPEDLRDKLYKRIQATIIEQQ
jgi:hypothetical protein